MHLTDEYHCVTSSLKNGSRLNASGAALGFALSRELRVRLTAAARRRSPRVCAVSECERQAVEYEGGKHSSGVGVLAGPPLAHVPQGLAAGRRALRVLAHQ